MDFFKLGLRNILGITLPGAVLVLVVSYVLYVCAIALGQDLAGFEWVADAEFLILVGLFLISYIVGSVIRLNSAGNVDTKSSNYHRYKYCLREWTQAREVIRRVKKDGAHDKLKELLTKIQEAIRSGDIPSEVLKKIGKVLSQPENVLLKIREANILLPFKNKLKGAQDADVVWEVLGQIEKANLDSDIFKEIVEEVQGELQKINTLDQNSDTFKEEVFQVKKDILTKVEEADVVSQLKEVLGQIKKANQDGEISKGVLWDFEEAMAKFDKATSSLRDEDELLFLIKVGNKRFFRQIKDSNM